MSPNNLPPKLRQSLMNAINAQRSTGPKTEEGKARSSQNSLKHGLYSKSSLLPDEDREEYIAFSSAYVADLKPQGPLQTELVQIISDNLWRLRRVRSAQASQLETVSRIVERLAPPAFQADEERTLETLSRHEQRLQNSMLKALKQLKELQRDAAPVTKPAAVQPRNGFVPPPHFTTPPPSPETPAVPNQHHQTAGHAPAP